MQSIAAMSHQVIKIALTIAANYRLIMGEEIW